MKRSIHIILSLALAMTVAFFGQAAFAQQHHHHNKGERLSQQQLLSLIATAKTPAEHRRLAHYYDDKAEDYLAQSAQHQKEADAYKMNPMTSSSKFATGTVNHCQFFAQSFKDDAAKMKELAQMHEDMAKDAEGK
jgi:hypothetical protein